MILNKNNSNSKPTPKQKPKTPRELRELEIKTASEDLFYFAKYHLKYDLLDESVHQELCNILSFKDPAYPRRKKLVLLPRDTFKSTIGTISLPIHLLTRSPALSILIHCEVFTTAKGFLSEIKARIEEPLFQNLYGNWIPGRADPHRYTESLIDILPRARRSKEGSLACSGVDKSITGQHYDVIICDDLVGETNYATADQLEKTVKNFSLVSESILKKNGILIVIGTRWNDSDVYGHILAQQKDKPPEQQDWDIIVRPAAHPPEDRQQAEWPPKKTTKYFFPARLDEPTLKKKWENLDDELFFSQYLLDPTPPGASAFSRNWFCYYNTLPTNERLNFFITLDPSTATKHGDFSAFSVVAIDQYWRWYVVEVVRDKLNPSDLIERLFSLNEKYHPVAIGIETVAFQIVLVHFLEKEQIARSQFLPIIELKTSTQVTKEQRIRALIPYFKQGQIFFPNPPTPSTEMLIQELVRFPKGRFDDIADSLAYIPQIAFPTEAPEEIKKEKPFHQMMWDRLMGREKAKSKDTTQTPKWMGFN